MATIQGVFLALFGRPADPTGLAFFNGQTANGANLAGIKDLSTQPEYINRFTGQTQEQIIQTIYQSLFGRAGDAVGVAFFLGELAAGRQTINTIAINILDGAQGTDKILVDKKLAASALFTAAIDTPQEVAAYNGSTNPSSLTKAVAFLTSITSTSPAITQADADAAVGSLSGTTTPTTPPTTDTGVPGVTINLTTASDTVSPNNANPALKSTADNDTINAPAGTFTSTTTIDGSAGTDSIFAVNTTATTATPTLSNTEKVFVTQSTNTGNINFSKATGVSEVWSKDSTASINFTELSAGTKVGFDNVNNSNSIDFKNSDVGGSSDTLGLIFKNSNVSLTVDTGIEKINIDVQSTSGLGLATSATEMTISGTGNFGINTAGNTTLKIVDAFALNGSMNGSTVSSSAGIKYTGTKQSDTVTFANNAAMDTIVFKSGNTSTSSSRDTYSNFDSSSEDKIDVSAYGITTGKTNITTFNNAPVENAPFNGNAVAIHTGTNTVYVDINSDGKYNAASDLVFDITGGTGNIDATDFIF